MHRMDKLSKAQRVVVVIAVGVVFLVLGSYLPGPSQRGFPFGWTGYAPLSTPNGGWPGGLRLFVWLAPTCLWAVASISLLRPSDDGIQKDGGKIDFLNAADETRP
jgi:hypothetical protein